MNKLASYLKTSNSNGTAAWTEWFSLHPRPIRLRLSSSTTWDWFVFGHRSMWSPLQFYQGPVNICSSKTMQTMAWSCSGSTLARHERFLRRAHLLHPRITNLRPKMNNMDAGSFNYYPQTPVLVHLHGLAPCFLTSKCPGLGCWTVHPSPLSLSPGDIWLQKYGGPLGRPIIIFEVGMCPGKTYPLLQDIFCLTYSGRIFPSCRTKSIDRGEWTCWS